MLLILLLILIAIYSYSYVQSFTYWTKLNVVQSSKWTATKENLQTTMKKLSFMNLHLRNYGRHQNLCRYIGFYQFGRPTLMVRDPELIKQITVKDRDQFMNRQTLTVNGNDPFWNSTLFALDDEKWHIFRSTLSPAFTANKMKAMFVLMDDTARDFTHYFHKNSNKQEVYQMKEIYRRFGADVIANCAFGHKCNSLVDRDNEFYKNGILISNFNNFWKIIQIAISCISKQATKVLDFKEFNPKASEFFLNIIQGQIKVREEKNIVRLDMLDLLIQARKDSALEKGDTVNVDFTDVEIAAQAMTFFVAGFETISTAMSFISYELALHPKIQQRLRNEIGQTLQECDGKLTYDALVGMKYMDMVILESLRKWPPVIFIDRLSSGKYVIKKSSTHSAEADDLVLDDKSSILIPIYQIHNDGEYFPKPAVFDPERFNDENKNTIKPYTYLPFGIGPRNCIGSRFALMELKIVLFYMLHQFEIMPNAKTQIPVQIGKGLFNLDSTDGIWLSFVKQL